jgi:hypothetical protein
VPGDTSNSLMAQADQILGCLHAPAEIVNDHTVEGGVRDLAIHCNRRNAAMQQPMKRSGIRRTLNIQDAVDLSREEQLDISLFARRHISRMAQQQTVATRKDRVIHSLGERSEKGVDGVGDD